MERHDCLKDNVIDSCCACSIIMSLNSYIMLSSYHYDLCFFHIMLLNSYIILSSYHNELCVFHTVLCR